MCLAAVVEKEGYNVKIIDNYLEKLNQVKLSKRVLQYNPDIVGISIACTNFYEGLRTANLVKTISDAFVVIGGPHATLRAKSFIKYPEVDAVVLGEGEYSLIEIIKRIEVGQSLEGCKGCYCKVDGKIVYNALRERINDLNSLPSPARHLVRQKSYPRIYSFGQIKRPIDTVCTSRGCPYNCTFCSSRELWGPKYRYRSSENVVDEIELLVKNYGTKGIYFREDNFTLNKKRVIRLCDELIKRNINVEWECSSRVDLVDEDLLKKMHEAGCKSIWYGFESGSPRTLKIISKGITIEKSRRAVKLTKKAGINIGGSFMIGIPGETKEDVIKTYNFIKELALSQTSLAHFLGVPDCQLYREIIKNKWYDSCDGEFFFVKLPNLSKEFLNEISDRLNRELPILRNKFNSENSLLSYLKKILNALKNPKNALTFIKNYVVYKIQKRF